MSNEVELKNLEEDTVYVDDTGNLGHRVRICPFYMLKDYLLADNQLLVAIGQKGRGVTVKELRLGKTFERACCDKFDLHMLVREVQKSTNNNQFVSYKDKREGNVVTFTIAIVDSLTAILDED